MKRFVIKKRSVDALRAALVTHIYCHMEQRTKTVYLGSLSVDLDPSLVRDLTVDLGENISIKVGAVAQGTAFELDEATRLEIALWLELNGSYLPRREAEARQRMEEMELEQARWSEIEMALRVQLEAEIRASVLAEFEALRPHPMLAAEHALTEAAKMIEHQAASLREAGHKLSRKRGQIGRKGELTPLDELRLVSDRMRKECFAAFEAACKRAGLMASRASS